MTPSLTSIELDLLKTLTRRVRILTLYQVAAGWWPIIRRQRGVRHNLRQLEVAGLVEIHRLIDRLGRILRLVESAGRYGLEQVESFHEHCVAGTESCKRCVKISMHTSGVLRGGDSWPPDDSNSAC